MKAALIRRFGEPLELADLPIPTPGSHQVVIRVEACGLCHTDLAAAAGSWPVKPILPRVPGHEVVGRIAIVGADVHHLHKGERVALGWLGSTCGRCRACLSGDEVLCEERRYTGYDVDGGFAEYVQAVADFVVPVPSGVDPLDAACLTGAGAAAYRAVKIADAGVTDLVAVFGIGGVGHCAIQYVRATGASVVAVDTVEEKLAIARELGAQLTVNAAAENPASMMSRLGGATCALVTTDAPEAMVQALDSLAPGGRLVLVAIPSAAALPLPVYRVVREGIDVIGSPGPARVDIADVFTLHQARRTRVVHQARSLRQVNEAMAELAEDKVPGRLVFELR